MFSDLLDVTMTPKTNYFQLWSEISLGNITFGNPEKQISKC